MSDKENKVSFFDIKAVILSLFVGLGVYVLLSLAAAQLIKIGCFAFDSKSVISKILFLTACLSSCAYVKRKGRGERFLNCLSTEVMMFAFAILIASMGKEKQWDTAGAVICLFCAFISCFIMHSGRGKSGKMHKKRRKTKSDITNRNHSAGLT